MVADAQKYGLDRAIAATPYGRDVQYRLSYMIQKPWFSQR